MTSDIKSVSVLQKILHHTSDVSTCDFWNNTLLATGSGDKTVAVWEWKTGLGFVEKEYSPLVSHKYAVTCVRFSKRGSFLVSSSADGSTILWSLLKGVYLYRFMQCGGQGVRACSISADETFLVTAGEGGLICVWDVNNRSLIKTIQGHDEESVQGVSFSPDGFLFASADVSGSVMVWLAGAGRDEDSHLATVRDAHDLGVNAIEFSPEYTLHTDNEGITERTYLMVTGGNDEEAGIWQVWARHGKLTSGAGSVSVELPILLSTLRGHTSAITAARFSSTGEILVTSSIDKTARIWQVSSGKCLWTVSGHSRYVACCAFSSSQVLLATGSNDKSLWIWDLTGTLDLDSKLHESPSRALISNAAYNMESRNEYSVHLLHKLEGHTGGVNTCCFSHFLLATAGSDKNVELWGWDGRWVGKLEAHRYAINQVEFNSAGNRLVSCSVDGSAILWDPHAGEVVNSGFHVSGSGVRCVRFSPESSILAVGGDDESAYLFNADDGQLIVRMEGHGEAVTSVGFSPDSKLVATGCADGHIRLFSQPSAQSLFMIEDCHDLGVTSLDFSSVPHAQPVCGKGKYELATCGQDCLVKVWKLDAHKKTSHLLWKLAGHGGIVSCVRYSPRLAELIASTATDKTCRLWDSYSGACLHVLNSHEGIVTSCTFSPDATLLATGSMDKTVQIWELPKDLSFQSFVASRMKCRQNVVAGWSVEEVNNWLEQNNLPPINLTGAALLESPLPSILDILNIEDAAEREEVGRKLEALRQADLNLDTPHDLLCPITHQIMRDPVVCSDGYTYERSAIEGWLRSGHNTSPMTNSLLVDSSLHPNSTLRATITAYLATPPS